MVQNYERLRSLSPVNGQSLDTIHHSVMCLSLDHFTSPVGSPETHPRNCGVEIQEHLHLVRSSWDGRNRFMDKPLSYIVDPLTRAGIMAEHSPADGLPLGILLEYTLSHGVLDDSYISSPEVVSSESPALDGWRGLEWVTDGPMEREFGEARERAKAVIADSDDNVLHFSGYGADWIKTQGQSRHVSLHRLQNRVLTKTSIHSPAFSRRIHTDGTPISVVPDKRELYCNIRDYAHTVIPSGADGGRPNADER